MARKVTYEEVKKVFESKGCTLLSTEYISAKSKLKYICSCGEIREIDFDHMSRSQGRCPKCRSTYLANSHEHVEKTFKEKGLVLLTKKYINGKQKLKFICKCGRTSYSTYSQILQGSLCSGCRSERIGAAHRLSIEDVRKIFKENGHILLEDSYVNSNQRLRFLCKCGNISYSTLSAIKSGHCCKKCAIEAQDKGVGTYGWAIYDTYMPKIAFCEEVKRDPENPHVLNVRCSYCNKWFAPKNWQALARTHCIEGKRSGECRFYCSDSCKTACPVYNQISWPKGLNPNKLRPGQSEFREMVLERDNYTCQICGHHDPCGEFLVAHHIDPVACNPIESMDVDNGVTLCNDCHQHAHNLPGCSTSELRAASY